MVIKEEWLVPEDRPWFTGPYWPADVPKQLDYDWSETFYDILERQAKEHPDYYVIYFLKTWITFKELKDSVDIFASNLLKLGIKKGSIVAVQLPNCIQYFVVSYALYRIGAILAALNPTYKPLEIKQFLDLTEAEYYIGLDFLYNDGIAPIENKLKLKEIILTNLVDQALGLSPVTKLLGKLLKKIPTAKIPSYAYKYTDMLKGEIKLPPLDIDPEKDLAVLIATGGTTGVPKAAALTHRNIVSQIYQANAVLGQRAQPTDPSNGPKTGNVGILPMFHSFGMTTILHLPIVSAGWAMLYPKPPETSELLKEITTIKFPDGSEPNGIIYCGAEILFKRIADLPNIADFTDGLKKRIRLCLSAAGPLHDYVRIPFEEKTGGFLTEAYGLSEASPAVTIGNFYGDKRSIGCIGLPIPGVDVKIFSDIDFDKGPIEGFGEKNTGEICVCGPNVMHSYYKNPERTAATLKEWNGKVWLLTGDIGFATEEGSFVIRDRKKQLIKIAGHSVFPKEVESLIGNHSQVFEVAVAGIPDPKLGEFVKAWVALIENATITESELIEWCKENMAGYKVPKEIKFVKEVPKSVLGKVMRRTLQEEDPRYLASMKK